MANGDTTAEILKDVLRKCGEVDNGTSVFQSIALSYINKAYKKIIACSSEYQLDVGQPWSWAISPQPLMLTLIPPITTGTVTLTNGSVNGTFSVAPSVTQAGNWLTINNRPEYFRIKTHTASTTAFTLDGVYTDTSASGLSFQSMQLDYTLTAPETAGIQRLIYPFEVYQNQDWTNDQEYKIYGISLREFRREFPLSLITTGVPTRFAVVTDTDGVFKVRFNKYVTQQTRVEVDYIPQYADLTSEPDTTPIIPFEFRDVLVFGAAHPLAKDKSDDRAESYQQQCSAILTAMRRADGKGMDQTAKSYGTLMPRLDLVSQRKKIYNL